MRRSAAVIARSAATKQSRLSLQHGLLRGACHRARIRAARWLAMTIQTQRIPTDALSSTRPQRPENFADLPGHHDVRRTDRRGDVDAGRGEGRSEEHTSELQSRENLVCRLLLEKK